MKVYPLSVNLSADWLSARLRVDAIRRDTLTALAEAWHEDEGGVSEAIENLAETLAGDPSPEELDARVAGVEDVAAMDDAHTVIKLADATRLRGELDEVIATLDRFGRPRRGDAA